MGLVRHRALLKFVAIGRLKAGLVETPGCLENTRTTPVNSTRKLWTNPGQAFWRFRNLGGASGEYGGASSFYNEGTNEFWLGFGELRRNLGKTWEEAEGKQDRKMHCRDGLWGTLQFISVETGWGLPGRRFIAGWGSGDLAIHFSAHT